MISEIKLAQIPSQEKQAMLGEQQCIITIFQRQNNVYMNLVSNSQTIFEGRKVISNDPITRSYDNFLGKLLMIDENGEEYPDFSGFSTRWKLLYIVE